MARYNSDRNRCCITGQHRCQHGNKPKTKPPLLHGSSFYRYAVTLASPVNTRTPPFHTVHLLSRPGLVLCRFAAFLDSPGTPVVELLTSVFSFIPVSYQANHVLLVLNRRGMLCEFHLLLWFFVLPFVHFFFLLHTFWQILLLGDKLKDALNELEKACLSSTTAHPFR